MLIMMIVVVVVGRIVRWMIGPRCQVEVWKISTRHSLVVTLTVNCRLDCTDVHPTILIPIDVIRINIISYY